MASVKLIPPRVRQQVAERDEWTDEGARCRICGQWTSRPGQHHIVYRSQGGLDVVENLLTVGWLPTDCNCHSLIAHGVRARHWREVFQAVIDHPEVTALQVDRWMRSG